MANGTRLVAGVVVVAAVLNLLWPEKTPAETGYEATCTVTSEDNGKAIAGAVVTIGSVSATTKANGVAVIALATPGTYDVRVNHPGYETLVDEFVVEAA